MWWYVGKWEKVVTESGNELARVVYEMMMTIERFRLII